MTIQTQDLWYETQRPCVEGYTVFQVLGRTCHCPVAHIHLLYGPVFLFVGAWLCVWVLCQAADFICDQLTAFQV